MASQYLTVLALIYCPRTLTPDRLKVNGGVPLELFFRSYVSTNQLPGNKRLFNSLLPGSRILSPEAMNPDLESIIKETKH